MAPFPRYFFWVARRWLVPCFRIILAMLLLFSFFDLLSHTEKMAFGLALFKKMLIRAPANLYELLPFAIMLSSMVAASQWMQHSEWTILRFAGWKTRHTALLFILTSFGLGYIGLSADRLYATYHARTTNQSSPEHIWIHQSGYIFNVEKVDITSAQSAVLHSVYIYPDTVSVLGGETARVHYVTEAYLDKDTLTIPNESSASVQQKPEEALLLPRVIPLPFYLILEPQSLESLDILFLAKTLWMLNSSEAATANQHPSQHILQFTLVRKCAYPFWLLYWMVWGSLVLNIPFRFKYIRFYQAGLFVMGSLLIFAYRSLSPIIMQQGISGLEMNGLMFIGGIILYQSTRWLLRKQTQAR